MYLFAYFNGIALKIISNSDSLKNRWNFVYIERFSDHYEIFSKILVNVDLKNEVIVFYSSCIKKIYQSIFLSAALNIFLILRQLASGQEIYKRTSYRNVINLLEKLKTIS